MKIPKPQRKIIKRTRIAMKNAKSLKERCLVYVLGKLEYDSYRIKKEINSPSIMEQLCNKVEVLD